MTTWRRELASMGITEWEHLEIRNGVGCFDNPPWCELDEEKDRQLDREFNPGYGSQGGADLIVWTEDFVIVNTEYGGSDDLLKIPRHPSCLEKKMTLNDWLLKHHACDQGRDWVASMGFGSLEQLYLALREEPSKFHWLGCLVEMIILDTKGIHASWGFRQWRYEHAWFFDELALPLNVPVILEYLDKNFHPDWSKLP